MDDYQRKYLKYKSKYLNLKKHKFENQMIGGAKINEILPDEVRDRTTRDKLNEIIRNLNLLDVRIEGIDRTHIEFVKIAEKEKRERQERFRRIEYDLRGLSNQFTGIAEQIANDKIETIRKIKELNGEFMRLTTEVGSKNYRCKNR